MDKKNIDAVVAAAISQNARTCLCHTACPERRSICVLLASFRHHGENAALSAPEMTPLFIEPRRVQVFAGALGIIEQLGSVWATTLASFRNRVAVLAVLSRARVIQSLKPDELSLSRAPCGISR